MHRTRSIQKCPGYPEDLTGDVTGGLLVVFLFLLAVFPCPAAAQQEITGVVLDGETGKPLQGANVFLDETTIGAATDTLGLYAIRDVPPGPYTVVASMVGYQTEERDLIVQETEEDEPASRRIDFELEPNPVELNGVTVEENRDEWLDRLDRFRAAFFGDVPNAERCEFINPEVLSFEQTEEGLVARAEEPLRMRNEALGYEVTYHLSRYVASPDSRSRYGNFEFDPLTADSQEQREAWEEARTRTYLGSFRHFLNALVADSLRSEGFEVGLTSVSPIARDRRLASGSPSAGATNVSKASDILKPAPAPGRVVLSIPRGKHLEVRYDHAGEHRNFARRYRGQSPRSSQRSWLKIVDGSKVLIETQSGNFVHQQRQAFGHYVLEGYWGWLERAPTALPEDFRPSVVP